MNKEELLKEKVGIEAQIEAIDKANALACLPMKEAYDRLEREIERLRDRKQALYSAMQEVEEPTRKKRQDLRDKSNSLKAQVEQVEREEGDSENRKALLTGPSDSKNPGEYLQAALKRIGRRHGRHYSDSSVRMVKHDTHNIVAVSKPEWRAYFAYDKGNALVSYLIADGGGHPGAYVSIDTEGCQEKESRSKSYAGVDDKGQDIYEPRFRKPDGFRDWVASSVYFFSEKPLSHEQLQEMFKRLGIEEATAE